MGAGQASGELLREHPGKWGSAQQLLPEPASQSRRAEGTGKDDASGKDIDIFEMIKTFFARHSDNCEKNLATLRGSICAAWQSSRCTVWVKQTLQPSS